MGLEFIHPGFGVVRDETRCTRCRICEQQCANEVHYFDGEKSMMKCDDTNCIDCQRYVNLCSTRTLKIVKANCTLRENAGWQNDAIKGIYKQASSGGVFLSSMGNPKPLPISWDNILMNASQVTNSSIDPLHEPMETRVYFDKKPEKIKRFSDGKLSCKLPPQLELSVPLLFPAMSYGSISYNVHKSPALVVIELGILYNTGEGGLYEDFYRYGEHTIVQVASRRFGVYEQSLNTGAAIKIKMGQGAKPGIGGYLPGTKIVGDVSRIRMIPKGSDVISPAPHHDIYSVEDLRQLVLSPEEAAAYKKSITVKVAAVHNVAVITSGIVRSGADIIAIDGLRGGTGTAPTRVYDSVGIPTELASAVVDQRLRDKGIRSNVSLMVGGSIRNAADAVKAITLGADTCYIVTAALLVLGYHLCRTCQSGECNWGIATQNPDLVKRLDPEIGSKRLANVMKAWQYEIKELMDGTGTNFIEALHGNRLMFRGIGLSEKELETLGISYAGK